MKRLHRFALLLLLLPLLVGCRPAPPSAPTTLTPQEIEPTQQPTPTQAVTPVSPPETDEGTLPDDMDLSYTETNPLTDPEEILRILEILQARELAWFSRSGWLQFTIHNVGYDLRHIWTHVIDENLACREQLVYSESEGGIRPYIVRLEDGPTGYVTEGVSPNPDLISETSPPCSLKSNWIEQIQEQEGNYDFILHDEALEFRTFVDRNDPDLEDQVRAWVEEMDGNLTLVVVYETNFLNPAKRGVVLDPSTGLSLPFARRLQFSYIDLETGLQVRMRIECYHADGRLLLGGEGGLYRYQWHDELPGFIAQAYEQTAQLLRAFLQDTNQ